MDAGEHEPSPKTRTPRGLRVGAQVLLPGRVVTVFKPGSEEFPGYRVRLRGRVPNSSHYVTVPDDEPIPVPVPVPA
jgi:hypothetical protein